MAIEKVPERPPATTESVKQMAAANKSLADALRFSFGLLSILMVLALLGLLLTGLTRVQPDEVGLQLLFGRIQGQGDRRMVTEGLRMSLPRPLGGVEKVSTGIRTINIDDFWMYTTADATRMSVAERAKQAPVGGLKPGFDGALLTGDRGQIHVKLVCEYSLRRQGRDLQGPPEPDAVVNYLQTIADPEQAVRAAVCNACIRQAATRTVESLYTTGKEDFVAQVKAAGQKLLDAMNSGVMINTLALDEVTPPLATIAAFDSVGRAKQDEDIAKSKARSQAAEILRNAVGASWQTLVGDQDEPSLLDRYTVARQTNDEAGAARLVDAMDAAGLLDLYPAEKSREASEAADKLLAEADSLGLRALWRRASQADNARAAEAIQKEIASVGLLRLYERALTADNNAAAGETLDEINTILRSYKTTGEASTIIRGAEAYQISVREAIASRAEAFRRLLPKYRESPELMISRLCAETKEEVFTQPTNTKYLITPGGRMVVRTSEDPGLAAEIEEEQYKEQK